MKFCRWYYLNFCSEAILNGEELVRQSYQITKYRSLRHKIIKLVNGKIEKDICDVTHPFILKYSSTQMLYYEDFKFKRQKYLKEHALKSRRILKFYRT